MQKYVLSIDNGFTKTKAVLFTVDGKHVSTGLVNTEVINIDNMSELNMEIQWQNTAKAIKLAIEDSGIDAAQIVCIGNSGHGAGLYMVGKDGKVIRNAVSAMDTRTMDILQQWNDRGLNSYDKINHIMWPGQMIPILNWIKTNEPDIYSKIDKVFMAKDWIKYNLTGKVTAEYSDSSNSGLINLHTGNYDREIFEKFDIGEMFDKLPELYKTTDIVGHVTKKAAEQTGLKEGTPVIAGMFDVVACALGSGVYDSEKYSIISGTWNINSAIETELLPIGKTVKCSLFADAEKYIYVESSATSAVNLEWFTVNVINGLEKHYSGSSIYKKIDMAVKEVMEEQSGVLYMPFLHKSHLAKKLSGSFFGLKPSHNIRHMLRAIFEGVAFAHLKHLRYLQNDGMVKKQAVISGGAANSELWCQIFADILNLEVITTDASQEGALGIAMCSAVAAGVYSDFEEAAKSMVKEKNRYFPNKEAHNNYMKKFAEFEKIIEMFENS